MSKRFLCNNEIILKFLKFKELLEINSQINLQGLLEDEENDFDNDLNIIEDSLSQSISKNIPVVFEKTVNTSRIIVSLLNETLDLVKNSQDKIIYNCLWLYSKNKKLKEIADFLCTTVKNASRILIKAKKVFIDYFNLLFKNNYYFEKVNSDSNIVFGNISSIKSVINSVIRSSDDRVIAVYDNIYEDFTTSNYDLQNTNINCSPYPSDVDYELLSQKSKTNIKTVEENSIYLKYIRQAVSLYVQHNRCSLKSKFIATEIFLSENTDKSVRRRYNNKRFETDYKVAYRQTMSILNYVIYGVTAIIRSDNDNSSILYVVDERKENYGKI